MPPTITAGRSWNIAVSDSAVPGVSAETVRSGRERSGGFVLQKPATPCHLIGQLRYVRQVHLVAPNEKKLSGCLWRSWRVRAAMASTYNARPLVQEVLVDSNYYPPIRSNHSAADELQYQLTDAGQAS